MSDSEREAKQVIVMRKDLNMRRGKQIAQGAHASLAVYKLITEKIGGTKYLEWKPAFIAWDEGAFTKICVYVDSEQGLMEIYGKAVAADLPVKLITDAGHTEFNGVPTKTCLAIGPAWSDDIDKITGQLKLL